MITPTGDKTILLPMDTGDGESKSSNSLIITLAIRITTFVVVAFVVAVAVAVNVLFTGVVTIASNHFNARKAATNPVGD